MANQNTYNFFFLFFTRHSPIAQNTCIIRGIPRSSIRHGLVFSSNFIFTFIIGRRKNDLILQHVLLADLLKVQSKTAIKKLGLLKPGFKLPEQIIFNSSPLFSYFLISQLQLIFGFFSSDLGAFFLFSTSTVFFSATLKSVISFIISSSKTFALDLKGPNLFTSSFNQFPSILWSFFSFFKAS